MEESRKVRLGVLIGGGGRLPAIVAGVGRPQSRAEIGLILSFKKKSPGLDWAIEQGLPAQPFRWSEYKAKGYSREAYDHALSHALDTGKIDLIVLAGWGLLLSPAFIERYKGRIINVHPALLTETFESQVALSDGRNVPVFRGNEAIEAALAAGVDMTGATVHYVTDLMDAGPILLKQEVPVLPGDDFDSLTGRIHAVEDVLLPEGIEIACQRILDWRASLKNVLIIGGGGREHALGWALSRHSNGLNYFFVPDSPQARQRMLERGSANLNLFFAPGNAGTARLPNAQNLDIGAEDVESLTRYALDQRPDLVVVGPEVPLAAGLADRLREAGLVVFGPGAAGARLEASKSWAKEFMQRYHIPTAAQVTFEEVQPALVYLDQQAGPFVIKADGLAAGKGVLVTKDRDEAIAFVNEALAGNLFGSAGRRILIEEFMSGVEVSVLALCDTVSKKIIALEPACDYKRAFDGDQGPNTGGMGAYSPPGFMTPELRQQINDQILQPTLDGLVAEGIDYRGIVYAGLMLTPQGPKVVEYNCRFGDPETQSLMPRINSDLLEILEATATGHLAELPPIEYKPGASVGIVLASGGYPGSYAKGKVIHGVENFGNRSAVFLFHAGTALGPEGEFVTSGGRVFNLVVLGRDIANAREQVYNSIVDKGVIRFEGMFFRRDIAAREVE